MDGKPVIWADEGGANFESNGHELSIIQGQQDTNTFSLTGDNKTRLVLTFYFPESSPTTYNDLYSLIQRSLKCV